MFEYDPTLVPQAIQEAAILPLNDAAYALWSRKPELDGSERLSQPTPSNLQSRLSDPSFFQKTVKRVMAKIQFDTENAQYGSTFPRLKSAHPKASNRDLRNAIKLAVKLEQTCNKNFSYSNVRPYWEDVRLAIAKARKDNHDFDFMESTYTALEHHMTIALR